MLVHPGWGGQPGPDIRCPEALVSLCLPGTRISVSSWLVNAALAAAVRQISLVNTCPRKQHNDLQVDGRSARGEREVEEKGLEEFQQKRCWRICSYTTRHIWYCYSNQSLEEETYQIPSAQSWILIWCSFIYTQTALTKINFTCTEHKSWVMA